MRSPTVINQALTRLATKAIHPSPAPKGFSFIEIQKPQPPPYQHKVAIGLSYCGKGYYGMTRLNGPTIEGEFIYALFRANLINRDLLDKSIAFEFQRASRTDRGVSAVRQVVSCLLPRGSANLHTVALLNSLLPSNIRVIGMKRAEISFCAQKKCNFRKYAYLFPTFALCPFHQKVTEAFRAKESDIEDFNKLLSNYLGSHNFYNFTALREHNDPRCNRNIISMECGTPFLLGGLEFAMIRVTGKSFMLHQIRKMLGLAFAMTRGLVSPQILEQAWGAERLEIPLAPGAGLMLEQPCYHFYNQKVQREEKFEVIEWEESQDVIHNFRKQYIFPSIVEAELKDKSMLQWLNILTLWNFQKPEDKSLGSLQREMTHRATRK